MVTMLQNETINWVKSHGKNYFFLTDQKYDCMKILWHCIDVWKTFESKDMKELTKRFKMIKKPISIQPKKYQLISIELGKKIKMNPLKF